MRHRKSSVPVRRASRGLRGDGQRRAERDCTAPHGARPQRSGGWRSGAILPRDAKGPPSIAQKSGNRFFAPAMRQQTVPAENSVRVAIVVPGRLPQSPSPEGRERGVPTG
ncbi:hypothetical protein EBBID32_39450 [Sphingobium indicum BiD32]|uniref:Uncharacterized protein n=1 Tax=Sphingobium indicum BiD32 TaxID=1301087 RepID=N1MVE6_9SPHN|nr:hypothetical protein EBBID32_39450 [Sphingobium indicum BiD32]